jgi:exonuclease III
MNLKSDVLFVSEHRLYENELYKLRDINHDFDVYAKASGGLEIHNQSSKLGHCGVALFWHKHLSNRVRLIKCKSDRLCAIEIVNTYQKRSLVVIGVYLPQLKCKITNFDVHMEEIESIVGLYKSHCEICIIGDFNCQFSNDVGNRFWGSTTTNGKKILQMIQANDLCIVDADENMCTGPNYTFFVEGVGRSYIDHCVMSSHAKMKVTNCEIFDDCQENTSDHLPISVTVQTDYASEPSKNTHTRPSIKWDKISSIDIKKMYTHPLDCKLSVVYHKMKESEQSLLECKDNAVCIIDDFLEMVTECIKATSRVLPQNKFRKHLKPYWNEGLTVASKHKKATRKDWIKAGKLRGNSVTFQQLKEAKRAFKVCQREAEK